MTIYHKIDEYYGVLVDGHTVFSGTLDACHEYLVLFGVRRADAPKCVGM